MLPWRIYARSLPGLIRSVCCATSGLRSSGWVPSLMRQAHRWQASNRFRRHWRHSSRACERRGGAAMLDRQPPANPARSASVVVPIH